MIRFLTVFLLPAFVFAQNSESRNLENYLTAFRAVNEFSGVVLVVRDNQTLLKKAFGFSDLERKIPNTTETRFRIASCSKQFTAIAILQLQERNKISVSDRLSKYFPDMPGSALITLDMMLSHRSGIHDLYSDSTFQATNTPQLTRGKILEMMKKNTLDFPPGSKYRYSNSGYFLLGLIIEKVSGEQFASYMNEHIFKKAHMYSSGVDTNDTTLPAKAKGYQNENEKLIPAAYDNMNSALGCGNLYSTLGDLYAYYQAISDTILLSKRSREQLFTPKSNTRIPTIPPLGAYAYGVQVDTLEKHPFITHGGWVYGFKSDLTMFFGDKALFVIMSNSEANVWSLSKSLQAVLFNIPVMHPYAYKEMKKAPAALANYAGQYGTVKVYLKGSSLYLEDLAGTEGEIKLIPETENKLFFEGENDRQIEFELDRGQKVKKAWITASGIKYELKQIN